MLGSMPHVGTTHSWYWRVSVYTLPALTFTWMLPATKTHYPDRWISSWETGIEDSIWCVSRILFLIWLVWLAILQTSTLKWVTLYPIRPIIPVIFYFHSYHPYHSCLHPPSLFLFHSITIIAEHNLNSPLSISAFHDHELTISIFFTVYNLCCVQHTLSTPYTQCTIQPVPYSPSTV
jgi:hypothetical protein